MYYVKNITWGELKKDGTIEVSFDAFLEDEFIGAMNTVSSIDVIQEAIVSTVKDEEVITNQISYEEALGLYNDITANTELFFE